MGNGTVGPVGVKLLKSFGCEVHDLYCDMDGSFPNHIPDPTVLENMQDLVVLVREKSLDIGSGRDGDGDRLSVEVTLKTIEKRPEPILVVGTGNVEYVLKLDNELQLGRKCMVTYRELFGGSGLNYTLRLINVGLPVFPILSIGKDLIAKRIRNEILASAKKAGLSEQILAFIDSDSFFSNMINTQRATIIIEKDRRTILAETIDGIEYFRDHLNNCLGYFNSQFAVGTKTIIIGHIHSDNPNLNRLNPGECTKYIIRSFHENSLIFANFGDSQIRLGVDFWEEYLRKIGVFQLDLVEMKSFFARKNAKMSLVKIIDWLKDKEITAVITLDKFGAIGTYKDGRQGVILARPHQVKGFVDPTGAGDAFGAGLISRLHGKRDFSFEDLYDAILEARLWAAYACTNLGGAAHCPGKESLREFYEKVLSREHNPIEMLSMKEADRILRALDKM